MNDDVPGFALASRSEWGRSLIGVGGPYELVEEDVLGERMHVFRERQRSVLALLVRGTEAFPDHDYLADETRRLTYARHLRAVAALAHRLRDEFGVAPGDRVAINAANRLEWVLAFWAAHAAGAIAAAMNSFWSDPELAAGIASAEPKLVIGDQRRLEQVARVAPHVPRLEMTDALWAELTLSGAVALPAIPVPDEDDPAMLLYTSGTTGLPKAVAHSHRGIVGFVQCNHFNAALRLGHANPLPGQRVLVSSPLFHLSALYGAVLLATVSGGLLVMRPGRFDEVETMKAIERERITLWPSLGSAAPRVAEHPELPQHDLSSLVSVVIGGAPVSPLVKRRLAEAFPSAAMGFRMGYTSTEGGSIVASIGGPEFHDFPESTGPLQDGVEVRFVDADGNDVEPGGEGEIYVRSPYLMLGYWRDQAATDAVLRPGRWLAMGDVGSLRDGRLYVNSRGRDLIFVSAENVYPTEVEFRIEAHPAVAEAAVVGVDDPITGQAVKAFVVVDDEAVSESELAAWCREALPPYKVPTQWVLQKEPLPRNATGKVLRTALLGEESSSAVIDA